jgi:Zn-dependent protease
MDQQELVKGLGYLIALVLSVCVHEFGHAWMADRLGDPLPRAQGRLTLNPLAHIDPLGTIGLPLLAFFLSLHGSAMGSRILGWGKPVQISLHARHMTRRWSIRTSHAMIAIAGPAMNILLGLVLSALFVAALRSDNVKLADGIAGVVRMNIGLFFFNLIPCPPLDGGAVVKRLLPRSLDFINGGLERAGQFILLALLASGALGVVMRPVSHLSMIWLNSLAGLVGYTFGPV